MVFKHFNKDFLSKLKTVEFLHQFFKLLDEGVYNESDLGDVPRTKQLLKLLFSMDRNPPPDVTRTFMEVFEEFPLQEFRRKLYRYSAWVALYLFMTKVHQPAIEKSKIFDGTTCSKKYTVYLLLKKQSVEKSSESRAADADFVVFCNYFKCSTSFSKKIINFIDSYFPQEFLEDEKTEITKYASTFM